MRPRSRHDPALIAAALLAFALTIILPVAWLHHRLTASVLAAQAEFDQRQFALMDAILRRVVRNSDPFVQMTERANRAVAAHTAGAGLARVLAPLRGRRELEVMAFDAAGRRVRLPGFGFDFVAVSERAIRAIRHLAAGGENNAQTRRISQTLFAAPETLVSMVSNARLVARHANGGPFVGGGWFTLSSRRPSRRPEPVRDLLVVFRRTLRPDRAWRIEAVNRCRRLLGKRYRLLWINRLSAAQRWPTSPIIGKLAASQWLIPRLTTAQRLTTMVTLPDGEALLLMCERSGDAPLHRLRRQAAAGQVALVLFALGSLAGLGRLMLGRNSQRIPLRIVVAGIILGAVLPTTAVFIGATGIYLSAATDRQRWLAHRQVEATLTEIDAGFTGFREDIDAQLRASLTTQQERLARGEPWSCPDDGPLRKIMTGAYRVNGEGTRITADFEPRGRSEPAQRLCRIYGSVMAGHLLGRPIRAVPGGGGLIDFIMKSADGVNFLLTRRGHLFDLGGFGVDRGVFLATLPATRDPTGFQFFMGFVELPVMQRSWLHRAFGAADRRIWLGAVRMAGGSPIRAVPQSMLLEPELMSAAERAWHQRQAIDETLVLRGGARLLVTVVPATRMANQVIIGATAEAPVLARIRTTAMALVVAALLFLAIAVWSVLRLSRHLLGGVAELTQALQTIADRSFAVRPSRRDDEFGRLHGGIAAAAHTLGEIAAAAPVRQTLGYAGTLRAGIFTVYGHDGGAAFLDGSCRDVLPLASGGLVAFSATVPGRAIPATLLAARIKLALSLLATATTDVVTLATRLAVVLTQQQGGQAPFALALVVADPAGDAWSCLHTGTAPLLLHDTSGWQLLSAAPPGTPRDASTAGLPRLIPCRPGSRLVMLPESVGPALADPTACETLVTTLAAMDPTDGPDLPAAVARIVGAVSGTATPSLLMWERAHV